MRGGKKQTAVSSRSRGERTLTAGITNCCLIHATTTIMQSDRSPLHWAASEGDQNKVTELLEQKVDVDPVDDVSYAIIIAVMVFV